MSTHLAKNWFSCNKTLPVCPVVATPERKSRSLFQYHSAEMDSTCYFLKESSLIGRSEYKTECKMRTIYIAGSIHCKGIYPCPGQACATTACNECAPDLIMRLPTEPLKPCCGLEPIPGCELNH